MKSEDFAQHIILKENFKVPDFSNNRPGTDKRIYAYAYSSTTIGGGKGISIQAFNHSDKPIATERLFRDLTIVTGDGKRYDQSEAEMMWNRAWLRPGEDATFNFKFPGVQILKEDVRLVICSFDMGETKIFLFPLQRPEEGKIESPKKKEVIHKTKTSSQKPTKPVPAKTKVAGKKTVLDRCFAPVKALQGLLRGMVREEGGPTPTPEESTAPDTEAMEKGDAASKTDQAVPPEYPLVKSEQVIDGIKYNFGPNYREEAKKAQKETDEMIARDRPWSMDNPDQYSSHPEAFEFSKWGVPRRTAQIVIVKDDFGFVVINAGYEDGFEKNVILDVLRNGRKIGKVMVTKPRDKIAGAVILSEWKTREEIRVGDLVGVSG